VSEVNAEQGSMRGPDPGPDDVADQAAADPAPDPGAAQSPDVNGSPGGASASSGDEAYVVDGDPRPDSSDEAEGELSVEGLVSDLERVTVERDQYLETSRRIQAEFENYRKQVTKRETEARERANEGLIGEMLPVLDAFDGALSSGVEDVAPMRTTLLEALAKQGLERIDPAETPFDPNLHEAVMHEEGKGGETGPVVAEVMRAGYSWKGRVVRPAMVRVRG